MENVDKAPIVLEDQDITNIVSIAINSTSTTQSTSVTELLDKHNAELHNKEQDVYARAAEFGLAATTSLEEIVLMEPNMDQDGASIELFLALQHDTKALVDEKRYFATIVPVEQSKLPISVERTEKILVQHPELNIFKTRGALVRVLKYASDNTSDPQDNIGIIELEHTHLILLLTTYGNFIKYDKRSKRFEKIDCPDKIATSLLSKYEWNYLRNLNGIITTPTIRSDGSILEKPGYDDKSGLLFIADDCVVPPIPEYPTTQDIKNALDFLSYILCDFPFDDALNGEASRSVIIAAILTVLTRHLYLAAPIIAITAPQMTSGKTLLTDIIAISTTGKSNSVITPAENETEEKKRLFALLREPSAIIAFDNITKSFGSATLCAITTQDRYKDRILGISANQAVSTKKTFLLNGNNLQFVGDIVSRLVLCKLNPKVDPRNRKDFRIPKIRQYVAENRGKIICAGLTLIRGYFAAGKPVQNIPTFARFELWSDIIRSTLVWCGMADPYANLNEIEISDPVQNSRGKIFSGLYEKFGNNLFQAKDVITVISPH